MEALRIPLHSCFECERYQDEMEDTHNGLVIVFCMDDKTRCVEGLESGCSEIIPKGW